MEMAQLICIIHNLWPGAESAGCQNNEGVRRRDVAESARSVYSRALSTRPGFGRGEPNQMTDSHSVFHGLCESARSTLV